MGSARITNGLMTAVSDVLETKNYDYQTKNGLRTGAPGDVLVYLYFAIPDAVKRGANVIDAKVHMFSDGFTQTGAKTVTTTPLNQTVNFSKVTYVTKPSKFYSGRDKVVTKTGPLTGTQEWIVDVVSNLQSVSNGDAWYGWRVKGSFNPLVNFYAPNHPTVALRPYLEITWSDKPDKPEGLAPSGGRAVGISHPTLRANYVDVAGSTVLNAVRVQINATADFTTPAWDSGVVLTSTPELDLSLTNYTGLTDGQVIYWRVSMQDGAGLWSDWSSPATFKRDVKGTLTLNNPPAGTPTVADVTPPILWDFTGETQAAYQLIVTDMVTRKQWTSGKVTSTDTSITLPPNVLVQAARDYQAALRVWDAKSRESVPNDPAYVEVVRTFTFAPTSAVAGTQSLTAVPQNPRPVVNLTWSRSEAADSFNVVRNGKVIATLAPEDVNTSATTYAWVDNSPSPKRALTYQVQAVVNGAASANNATQTVTLKSSGTWLRDPISGDELFLAGTEGRSWTLQEQNGVLEPIADGANKVLISQAQAGLQGQIQGTLVEAYGKTAQQWRDLYMKMRANAGRKFYLTSGDYTMLVVVYGFTCTMRGISEPVFDVSFDFIQQDSIDSLVTG